MKKQSIIGVVVFMILAILAFAGCSPKIVQSYQRDSTYRAKIDSLIIRDSIYIDRTRTVKEKGDTVYVTDTKTEYKYRYRDREIHDTAYIDRRIEVPVEVPAKITKWQTMLMQLGKIFSAILCGIIIFFIGKLAVRFFLK